MNAPIGSEVALVIVGGDESGMFNTRSHIVLNYRHGRGLKKLDHLHRSYDPLLYVLLFPRGEDGFKLGQGVTAHAFYRSRLQRIDNNFNSLFR